MQKTLHVQSYFQIHLIDYSQQFTSVVYAHVNIPSLINTCTLYLSFILTWFIAKIEEMLRSLFRNIPRYVRWVVWTYIHLSFLALCEKMLCVWSSNSCQLQVNFTFSIWCWHCIFRISMLYITFYVNRCYSKLTSFCYMISWLDLREHQLNCW